MEVLKTRLGLKSLRPGFEIWSAVLFALVMLPNIVWFALPERPFDILRIQNRLPAADAIASIARVLMIACLCFLKNRDALPVRPRPLPSACALCVLAYCAAWALYFSGIGAAPVIWGLCLFPCAAFILFSIDRKNLPALVCALIFAVCHAVCTEASLRIVWSFNT